MALLVGAIAVSGLSPRAAQLDAALVDRARAVHERVITLDTHVDIDPETFVAGCNYTQRLRTQVDLPKMIEGGLDAAFFIVYTGQGPLTKAGYDAAYREAVAKFDAVHRLTEKIAPDRVGLALTPADVQRLAGSGRRVAMIGVENGYPIGTDLSRVSEFYERGGRYLSLAHNGHNQLADSNTGEATGDAPNAGISPIGRAVIAEMNRLGMMVDVSHPSKTAMLQAAELSKAPIIASHSAVRALANHSRNLDDEQLLAIQRSNGVAQIVAFATYIVAEPPERTRARQTALASLRREVGIPASAASPRRECPVVNDGALPPVRDAAPVEWPPERRNDYLQRLQAIRSMYPPPRRATVGDFVDHIDYAVRKIGIDHVGISSDFDGGGGIDGWSNAAETFNVTLELVRRGYMEEQIAKMWSGNLLRVWRDTEAVARSLQGGVK